MTLLLYVTLMMYVSVVECVQLADELKKYGLTLTNYASIREQSVGGFIQVRRLPLLLKCSSKERLCQECWCLFCQSFFPDEDPLRVHCVCLEVNLHTQCLVPNSSHLMA